MTRGIHICADDYALSPGVSSAIRTLAAAGRISATSVMTVFAGLPEEAALLGSAVGERRVSIGLHVTLTGRFAPLVATPVDGVQFPSLGRLMAAAFGGGLRLGDVAAEVEAQFQAFRAAFGRGPDHVDGHQHAHLLPGIRSIVLDATARHAPGVLVRDCTQSPGARIGFDAKGRLISLLARGLAREARARGLQVNTGFAGAYDLRQGGDFPALFARFVSGLGEGGLVMVHPGHVDEVLAGRDPVLAPREAEFGFLSGPELEPVLRAANVHLL